MAKKFVYMYNSADEELQLEQGNGRLKTHYRHPGLLHSNWVAFVSKYE